MGCNSSTPITPPESIELFFNGEPMAGKADKFMGEMVADSYNLAFVGQHVYPFLEGKKLDKAAFGVAAKNLLGSFPDLTFNFDKATPKRNKDGSWSADIVVMGTHTGAAFSAMPGKLPEIDKTDKCVKIGPETFTLWVDDAGKVCKVEIQPLGAGHPHGPPGFYAEIGGVLPEPPKVPEVVPEEVPEEVSALLKKFNEGMNGDAEALKATTTAETMFNPPGAPPMSMEVFAGMMAGMKGTWPDWTSRLCFVELGPEPDTYIVGTQQCIGVMKADFPAMGPFPAVAMADVPARCKTDALTLPVEVGLYTIKDGKVLSGAYKPNGEYREDWKANGGVEPDSFSMEWWPQGMVGFGLVFKFFDKLDLLPGPPPS